MLKNNTHSLNHKPNVFVYLKLFSAGSPLVPQVCVRLLYLTNWP